MHTARLARLERVCLAACWLLALPAGVTGTPITFATPPGARVDFLILTLSSRGPDVSAVEFLLSTGLLLRLDAPFGLPADGVTEESVVVAARLYFDTSQNLVDCVDDAQHSPEPGTLLLLAGALAMLAAARRLTDPHA